MGTKTEEYLRILAEGGDAPTDCCMTNTQKLIYDAAVRVNNLDEDVQELKNNPDVVDIVSTYQDLQNYDTSTLTDKDIIRVLSDSTHGDQSSYYRYNATTGQWAYVGTGGGATLTINVGSGIYTYNGSQNTTINIGGGGATMFYADLQNVHSSLSIYTDASQTDYVDSVPMIDALSRGPVMIKDMNDNNIFVTVVSANGSSGPLNIVIDMYDDQGNPARRRFECSGPDWSENPF